MVNDQSVAWLLDRQMPLGYWCGELEADTTLESDYILYLHVLGRTERVRKLAAYIRRHQLPDGGWNIYEGGPSELNATVKAYLALKLAGDPLGAAHMARARERALALGGVDRTNSFTRFYLALVGAIGWDRVPAIPPELVLLPTWCPFSIYRMSSWTRAIVVPLTILYALKPRFDIGPAASVSELFGGPIVETPPAPPTALQRLFLSFDTIARRYARLPFQPGRRRSLDAAERWLLEHVERSDGLAAIYPAIMNAAFALIALGRPHDDPALASQIAALESLEIEDQDTIRVQPCVSPVWDTAIAMSALADAGLPPDHPALLASANWLLDREIRLAGDWQVNNPSLAPGGWAFEFRNDFYPDVDDTAFVLLALQRVSPPDGARVRAAVDRGIGWLLGMQNDDGGWGAFDRNNDTKLLTQVPFADHNAMLDPSTVDVTARVVEALASCGRAEHPAVARAVAYIARQQEPSGAFYGRWGVNYIYGTSGVLRAADALGIPDHRMCRRAADWLEGIQNGDGGFGEACASYDEAGLAGRGPSTPSQTAWALIGLLAAGRRNEAVARAADYLLERAGEDGTWEETATTGTGFPCVFYLKYHLYRHSFPLMALARWQNAAAQETDINTAWPARRYA
jgi:squalene-hopene/tetraprenyl-beta-curcumene cyclase